MKAAELKPNPSLKGEGDVELEVGANSIPTRRSRSSLEWDAIEGESPVGVRRRDAVPT